MGRLVGASSTYMGHKIHATADADGVMGAWGYSDTDKPLKNNKRNCIKCDMPPTEDGHDPCIANLPGVKFACCGHGVEEGYVMFNDGRVIRFENMYKDEDI